MCILFVLYDYITTHIENIKKLMTDCSTVVKVLCYSSEGRWFDPSWCQWIFIDIKSL